MNDTTAEDVLKKTFEHLEDVIEEKNHESLNGIGNQLDENKYRRNKEKNIVSENTQDKVISLIHK